ncbi:MAG: arginase family protein, partial [Rhodothermales bacterium]|nr:arginase family protein [Rhodothermales bacterium]
MPPFDPPAISPPETAPDDPRVGHLLGRALRGVEEARAVILGFPCDEGVRRNGGRPGAAAAPDALRQALYRFTPDARHAEAFHDLLAHTADLGNLRVEGTMEEAQRALGRALAPFLQRGAVPIVLGGGHETAFGHFLGYAEAGRAVSILNVDAHADVRPLRDGRGHSGSPFRQALEHPSG